MIKLKSILLENKDKKIYWITPDGRKIEADYIHWDEVGRRPELFLNKSQMKKFEDIKHDTEQISWMPDRKLDSELKELRAMVFENGAVRMGIRYNFASPVVFIQGTLKAIRKNLDKLIIENKNAEYTVDVVNDNGKTVQAHRLISLKDFMNKFSGRSSANNKSKIARFR